MSCYLNKLFCIFGDIFQYFSERKNVPLESNSESESKIRQVSSSHNQNFLGPWFWFVKSEVNMYNSLDQNKLFVSESLPPLTQLANGYKEPTIQFSEL